ncbi:atlastin-1 [Hyalella azteca]|uniref:Atlastin-1 n=1 Tax=Hyalella azteca TaxID=294128 RepID=A0A8B7NJC6_HYAAZ|nr:atlastin-1 [Hyalella azteca]
MGGHVVPIVVQKEGSREFELNEEALMSVLHRPEVRDTALCVVSIAGAFRKGKSFFMNCLLKYCMNKGSPDWLGEQLQPIGGFVWRAGMERETTGISIWSEPFLFTKSTGEKVAVILMDTQGTFDLETSAQESTFIFALTLLASSVTVYNLMNQIQEDDLMNLQTFSSYGVLAQENSHGTRSFQKLIFLVRDWSHSFEHDFGHEEGKNVLEKVLKVKEEQEPGKQRLRQGLRQSFEELECYLMPHIGTSALRDRNFKGHLEQLAPLFVEHLKLLVPRLLAPENLVVKRSCVTLGMPATADELVELFRTFIKFFNDGKLVQATSMVELISRMASEAARKRALDVYREAMDSISNPDGEDLQAAVLVEHHFASREKALAVYAKENPYAKNCAVFPIADEIREELKSEMEEMIVVTIRTNEEEQKARSSCAAASKKAKKAYEKAMSPINCPPGDALGASSVLKLHADSKDQAMAVYDELTQHIVKTELLSLRNEIRAQLEVDIEKEKTHYVILNGRAQQVRSCSERAYTEAVKAYVDSFTKAHPKISSSDISVLDKSYYKFKNEALCFYTQMNKGNENIPIVKKFRDQLEKEINMIHYDTALKINNESSCSTL